MRRLGLLCAVLAVFALTSVAEAGGLRCRIKCKMDQIRAKIACKTCKPKCCEPAACEPAACEPAACEPAGGAEESPGDATAAPEAPEAPEAPAPEEPAAEEKAPEAPAPAAEEEEEKEEEEKAPEAPAPPAPTSGFIPGVPVPPGFVAP